MRSVFLIRRDPIFRDLLEMLAARSLQDVASANSREVLRALVAFSASWREANPFRAKPPSSPGVSARRQEINLSPTSA